MTQLSFRNLETRSKRGSMKAATIRYWRGRNRRKIERRKRKRRKTRRIA